MGENRSQNNPVPHQPMGTVDELHVYYRKILVVVLRHYVAGGLNQVVRNVELHSLDLSVYPNVTEGNSIRWHCTRRAGEEKSARGRCPVPESRIPMDLRSPR